MLQTHDPEMYQLIEEEKERQEMGLELIASENFTSPAVLECLGSVLTNKYSEGQVGARYYGGTKVIDKIESLCQSRALATYRLNPEEWGVNVQPYSGSVANLAAYLSILNPHDRIMGLDLPSGGHLTHGFYTATKKVSCTSIFFESMPYHIKADGYIDYDELERNALIFRPKLIICGASAYPRDFDYQRFRKIADLCKAYLLCDMAHISGLVATQEANNPFEYCDLVTTTTHKTLRGPRAGMIFYKMELKDKVNSAVFPSIQGGPHNNQIAAVATQLKEVMTPEFKQYIQRVKLNAKQIAKSLMEKGYKISTDGTDNHLLLVNLKPLGITGSKIEKLYEFLDISVNKNSVYGDTSALNPGGIRIGTPCLTTQGYDEKDFEQIAEFLHRGIQIGLKIQQETGKLLKDFLKGMVENSELLQLKAEIKQFIKEKKNIN